MTSSLGSNLKIRGMVYVAGEPIPFYWPMRSFIHHNPLHGLEHLPFPEAVEEGTRLFKARGFLTRSEYQDYLVGGQMERTDLAARVESFLAGRDLPADIDVHGWLMTLLTQTGQRVARPTTVADVTDIHAVLNGQAPKSAAPDASELAAVMRADLLGSRPVYEAVDALYGTQIGAELDELVIKSCLDFFDEGQSVWGMPEREQGFFAAWRDLAVRNGRLYLRGLHIGRVLDGDGSPEGLIARVMGTLGVPEQYWTDYFTRELVRLHGWAGFIRWRSHAGHYYWGRRYPADTVDFLAVRLTLALALLSERGRRASPVSAPDLENLIEHQTPEAYLRFELYGGTVVPALAARVERVVTGGRSRDIERLFAEYLPRKRTHEAHQHAGRLQSLARKAGDADRLSRLGRGDLRKLLDVLREFERQEGMIWLGAMESHAISRLVQGVDLEPPAPRKKRPFVQALFCIDTRSERIRRQLENVGDYQTYGIAGFFGVPISFMELGKGSENHLCPVLLTPKHLVLEVAVSAGQDDVKAVTALEKAVSELKQSVLTPYFTVEAIGLLFGFDMVGKTLLPRQYGRWRRHLHEVKPHTHLLLDKLSREQADSVVRTVQRAVIAKAIELELGLEPEAISDTAVRELREAAMGHQAGLSESGLEALALDQSGAQGLIGRLRDVYRIAPSFAQLQMERLARIGFSLDEQAAFVGQALRSIGLTSKFSRFVLLVGHGSTSENNPYESALDCGACGGNHGLVNARALAQMANKPQVRRLLRAQGVEIAEDAHFVPALHDTTTDRLKLFDLDRIPATHVIYLDRLQSGTASASRLCTQERMASLEPVRRELSDAFRQAQRNAVDWAQVRPEWGLAGNAYFVIGRRSLTQSLSLEGRAFLHSYDYRIDPKRRLLENILAGPLVVGQWINMEHYFSTVDNERFGAGSKVYHNVAGRFGVMTGNLSDLRTGLPAQSVLEKGAPYHEPLRLIAVIEAPFEHARRAVENVASAKHLVRNLWIRLVVVDPEEHSVSVYEEGEWVHGGMADSLRRARSEEVAAP